MSKLNCVLCVYPVKFAKALMSLDYSPNVEKLEMAHGTPGLCLYGIR